MRSHIDRHKTGGFLAALVATAVVTVLLARPHPTATGPEPTPAPAPLQAPSSTRVGAPPPRPVPTPFRQAPPHARLAAQGSIRVNEAHAWPARPTNYYLALGDSISYGFQTAKALAGLPSAYDTGYVDQVAAHLRVIRRPLTTVNYACPGESSTTIGQPCVWRATGHALHDDYAGAQLRAALQFLRAHRDHVKLITLALGSNDIDAFLGSCPSGDLACVEAGAPAAIEAFAFRMNTILRQLGRAAPRATLVVVGLYDPNVTALAVADPLFAQLNNSLYGVTVANRGRFADVMSRFNPATDEEATICALTLICTADDAHPSDAGYLVMAEQVLAAYAA